MADVRILCVREDLGCAESLADFFEDAGISVAADPDDEALATIILWSDASIASLAFLRRACEAADADCVVASLTPPRTRTLGHAPVVDLSGWNGEEPAPLTPLLGAIETIIAPKLRQIAETLPDFDVLPPPSECVFFVEEDEPPAEQAPEPVAPHVVHISTAHWRQLRAEKLRSRRIAMASAVAVAFVALIGFQVTGASSRGEISVSPTHAVAATAATTVAVLYDPVEIDEIQAISEPVDNVFASPAPPRRLLEPASAPARRERTPPPYRSWDHQPAAHIEAVAVDPMTSTTFEPVKATTIDTQTIQAEWEEASVVGWQSASYTMP